MPWKSIYFLIQQTFTKWVQSKAPRMGAALAYYTVFSLAPLLITVIALAGFFVDRSRVQGRILDQISLLIGPLAAQTVEVMISAAQKPQKGILPSLIAVVSLIIGATGALVELQSGLNRIFEFNEGGGVFSLLKQRLTSLFLISGIAFLLLVSLIISALITAFGAYLNQQFPMRQVLWHTIDMGMSWGIVLLLFGMIYKVLPDGDISWKNALVGGAMASFLFTVGKFIVGLYIGKSAVASTYGAAGSFVVILIWVYYSAMIVYFGAEFSKVYSDFKEAHS